MFDDITWWWWIVLPVTGFAAGFVDSIAGGGGIITVPVLLQIGLPVHIALGTNKLQGSFGSTAAAITYTRRGLATPKTFWYGILFTFIGAGSGALILQMLPPGPLVYFTIGMLTILFALMVASPKLGEEYREARMGKVSFHLVFGLLIGFYDGFFGPGTGSFWAMAYVLLLGLNLKEATGQTKVMNCTSNLTALAFLALGGKVLLIPGVMMGIGQVAGARLGATLVAKHSTKFVKAILILVTGATLARLIYTTIINPS